MTRDPLEPQPMSGPPFRIVSVCAGGGYRYCRTDPPHPRRNAKGLYPLHRVVAENRIGRLLADDEVVHHVNYDKTDDTSDNLAIVSNAEHSRDHQTLPVLFAGCPACRRVFTVKSTAYRMRMRRNATGLVACSRSCGAKLGRLTSNESAGYEQRVR